MSTDATRVRFPFSSVSPQATNLQLNTVRDLRRNWVSLLLGGENSRWSNFQLAESLGRLVTGRDVRGRFMSEIFEEGRSVTPDPADLLPETDLRDGVRRRVLSAMERVVATGTAARLNPWRARLQQALTERFPDDPYDVYLFAKTGTPYVEKRSTAGQTQVLERLVREGNLRWDGTVGRFDLPAAGAGTYFNRLSAGFRDYLRTQILAEVERDPAAFTVGGDRAARHPIYLDANGSIRVNEVASLVQRRGATLLLGILAVPRDQGRQASRSLSDWISACSLDSELRGRILSVPPSSRLDPDRAVALSTALFVDDLPDIPGVTSGRAVTLMNELLPELEEYLVREVSLRTRDR